MSNLGGATYRVLSGLLRCLLLLFVTGCSQSDTVVEVLTGPRYNIVCLKLSCTTLGEPLQLLLQHGIRHRRGLDLIWDARPEFHYLLAPLVGEGQSIPVAYLLFAL